MSKKNIYIYTHTLTAPNTVQGLDTSFVQVVGKQVITLKRY